MSFLQSICLHVRTLLAAGVRTQSRTEVQLPEEVSGSTLSPASELFRLREAFSLSIALCVQPSKVAWSCHYALAKVTAVLSRDQQKAVQLCQAFDRPTAQMVANPCLYWHLATS